MSYGDGDEFNFGSSVHGDASVTLNITVNVYGGNGPAPVIPTEADFQRAVQAGVLQAMQAMKQAEVEAARVPARRNLFVR